MEFFRELLTNVGPRRGPRKMNIIAHRGLWKERGESNTLPALQQALHLGQSIETDIRSLNGEIFLSHDPITASVKTCSLKTLLDSVPEGSRCALFLNVKEDGLLSFLEPLKKSLLKLNTVFFDMSVPELVKYSKVFAPAHLCTRISDFEPTPNAMDLCDFIWVDGFERDLTEVELASLPALKKRLAFVSPELHGREHSKYWKSLDRIGLLNDTNYLCTDFARKWAERQAA